MLNVGHRRGMGDFEDREHNNKLVQNIFLVSIRRL